MSERSATYIFWSQCKDASANNPTEEIIKELFDEARGYERALIHDGYTELLDNPSPSNLRTLCGWLAYHMDIHCFGSTTHIENNNVVSATASNEINLDIVNQTMCAIDSSGLPPEEIEKLKSLLFDLSASKGKDPKSIINKFINGLEIAKSSTQALKAIWDFAFPIIQNVF